MSSRKTYDTDIITLRRIFAVSPGTNAPIPSGNIMATTSHGEASYVDPYSVPAISQLSTALLSLPSTISTSVAAIGGVSQLLAGSGISLSPTNGIGNVTITATGGGGFVTTDNLTSTVIGLGTAGYLSSATATTLLGGLVSTANLSRLISTANLAGHISTANLAGLVSTSYFANQLASTVIGLGTAGYISSAVATLPGGLISTANLAQAALLILTISARELVELAGSPFGSRKPSLQQRTGSSRVVQVYDLAQIPEVRGPHCCVGNETAQNLQTTHSNSCSFEAS
jgi:hypothetical protein